MERVTRQRQAILQALQGSGRSLSPQELLDLAQRDVPTLSLSTVYRQLKALVEGGLVATVDLPGQPPRFERPLSPADVTAAAPCPDGCHAHGEHHHDAHGHVAPGPAPAATARHRHHFHCTACDEVTPIEGCPGGIDALAPAGWRVERHDLTLHGRCGKCLAVPDGPTDSPRAAASAATA